MFVFLYSLEFKGIYLYIYFNDVIVNDNKLTANIYIYLYNK